MSKAADDGQRPPGSLRRKIDEEGISTRQAVGVLAEVYGVDTTEDEIGKALRAMGYQRAWSTWYLTPEMIAVLAGVVRQRRALWWQRRMVRGDVLAEVSGLVDGRVVQMYVPYERVFDPRAREEEVGLFRELPLIEWPTGLVTGKLVLDPEQEQHEATPRYIVVRTREGER